MAIIDCDFWVVRRKLGGGAAGASQVMASAPAPQGEKRVPYIRLRPTGCRSSSSRQTVVRGWWAYAAYAWNHVLEEWERASWNEAVGYFDNVWYDEEQQGRHLTGYEMWMATQSRRLGLGYEVWRGEADWGTGYYMSEFVVELLTPSTIRIWWEPDGAWSEHVVVLMRGPMSVGCHAAISALEWWRDSVPSRWKLVGYTPRRVTKPYDLELPEVVPSGRKVAFAGNSIDDTGMVGDDWLVEELVA